MTIPKKVKKDINISPRPPQPQYPPSMAAIPQTDSGSTSSDYSQMNPDITGMSFSAVQPASMTITVPPGVVPGQVLGNSYLYNLVFLIGFFLH